MTESEAKSKFSLATSRALQINDGVVPSREVVAKFTLHSSKVGEKVHMDATPSVDGTLTCCGAAGPQLPVTRRTLALFHQQSARPMW